MSKFLNKKLRNVYNKGYAILFTIIIISTILSIGAGVSNTLLKQLILSSTARNSQVAFYEVDTAIECAIYASEVIGLANVTNPWQCGLDEDLNPVDLEVINISMDVYHIGVIMPFSGPCFSIDVNKSTTVPSPYTTEIKARGYNICDPEDKWQVERGIEVDY